MPRDLFSNQVQLQGSEQPSSDITGQVSTFLGKMPSSQAMLSDLRDPETIKQALNAGMSTVGGGMALKGAKALLPYAEKGIAYLRPGKEAEGFLQDLGNGATSQENSASLAKDLHEKRTERAEDALSHKDPIYEQLGNKDMISPHPQEVAEGNIDKVAKVFSRDKSDFNENNIAALKKALTKYRKSGDFQDFIDKGEDIFGHEGLSEKEISKLDDLMGVPLKNSEYIESSAEKWFPRGSDLEERHLQFKNNPTLNNADLLQQDIGNRIGELKKIDYRTGLDTVGRQELKELSKSRDALLRDQDKFIESHSPFLANQNKIFRQKWRENVTPYDENPVISDIARHYDEEKNPGVLFNLKSGDISKFFMEPNAKAQKVAQDLGEEGRRKILYNELQSSEKPNVEQIVKGIQNTKQFGGQQYISPQMESMAENLSKREAIRKHLQSVGGGIGGFMIGGVPGAAVGMGAMSPFVRSLVRNLLEKSTKKL